MAEEQIAAMTAEILRLKSEGAEKQQNLERATRELDVLKNQQQPNLGGEVRSMGDFIEALKDQDANNRLKATDDAKTVQLKFIKGDPVAANRIQPLVHTLDDPQVAAYPRAWFLPIFNEPRAAVDTIMNKLRIKYAALTLNGTCSLIEDMEGILREVATSVYESRELNRTPQQTLERSYYGFMRAQEKMTALANRLKERIEARARGGPRGRGGFRGRGGSYVGGHYGGGYSQGGFQGSYQPLGFYPQGRGSWQDGQQSNLNQQRGAPRGGPRGRGPRYV